MEHPLKKLTNPESFVMQRRIGSTTFKVNVHFSNESRETLKEKSLRFMKNDLNFTHKNGNIKPLQAGWLSKGVHYDEQ